MPNSKQHQAKANRNRDFLASIDVGTFPDWAAVTAFYVAVHRVERRALLRCVPGPDGSSRGDA